MERDRSVRPGNQFGDGLDVDRLGHVVIHAGLLRSSPILFLSVARKGNDEDVMKTFLTQGSGNLIAVHDGQAYVQQEDAGSINPCGLDSLAAVEDNLNLMAEQTQQPGQAGCKVLVVVHDQDPALLGRLRLIHPRTLRHGNHRILLGGRKPRLGRCFVHRARHFLKKYRFHVIQPVSRQSSRNTWWQVRLIGNAAPIPISSGTLHPFPSACYLWRYNEDEGGLATATATASNRLRMVAGALAGDAGCRKLISPESDHL